ncbi:hypothetical protein ACGFK1_25105 [Mycobacterium sp. NPDC048908]|uniref:hypothetical protein n=1 Tax=Mycobacterium sp. NPDC048908 TaxID=3364292 RepID=UPI00371A7403
MSELSTTPTEKQDVVKQPEPVIEQPETVIGEVSQPPVVITAQEVAFSTAAAVSLPRAKPTHGVIANLRALFLSPPEDARPVPRHYPPRRDEFLEQAAMRREMYRL